MQDLEMQNAFLGYLYCKNFDDEDSSLNVIDSWVKTSRLNKTVFWNEYESMINSGLIKFVQDEGTVRLTPEGTLYAEKLKVASADKIARNRDTRKRLMLAMAEYLTRKGAIVPIKDLIMIANLNGAPSTGNIELLVGMGYAKWKVPAQKLAISAKVCAKVNLSSRAA